MSIISKTVGDQSARIEVTALQTTYALNGLHGYFNNQLIAAIKVLTNSF